MKLLSPLLFNLLLIACMYGMHTVQNPIRENKSLQELLQSPDYKIGLCALNPKTGHEFAWNAQELFPMASMRKVIFACYLFDCIQQQKLHLDQTISISRADLVPGSGTIKEEFAQNPRLVSQSYKVQELIRKTIEVSDNTAADGLMKRLGGHEAVDEWLQKNNIKDIHFKTTLKEWLGHQAIKTLRFKEAQQQVQASQAPWYYKGLSWLASSLPEPNKIDFSDETTNIATPRAYTQFLARVYDGTAPGLENPEHRKLLLDFMTECKTGSNRIQKYLPPELTFRNKTGTGIVGICNDGGILEDPAGDPWILTINVKDSVLRREQLEEVIALTAEALYKGFKEPRRENI